MYIQNVCLSAESSYLPAAAVNKLRVNSQAEATSRSYKCDVTSVIGYNQLQFSVGSCSWIFYVLESNFTGC